MKKGYTLIELLAVIVILSVIAAIAYPKIIDVIGSSKIKAYNVSKKNIVESAKLKYLADVNSLNVSEYKVVDLIDEGYIKNTAKNPLTNEKYTEDAKVLITNDNGNVSYSYVEGETLYDIVSKKNSEDGVYKEDLDYIYKGEEAQNYVSFNGEIYRILRIDSYRNAYILKDEKNKNININNIKSYINSYYNDNYSEKEKNEIVSFDILDYQSYLKSFNDDDSYILNNNDIWVNYNSQYKTLNCVTNKIEENSNANIRFVVKLKNDIIVRSGEGTQLNPYILGE